MPEKIDIRNLSFEELSAYFSSIGEKPFRAVQVFEWIYQRGVKSFSGMTNVSKDLRGALASSFFFALPPVVDKRVSGDKTTKYLFELDDKEKVETVMIPTLKRATVCVSTQAGCKFGCRFCASGIGGWNRNLSSAEIVSQILHVKNEAKDNLLSNIVFMGVGEPLDNYDNLLKAIRIINDKKGINLGARRITISTCGIVPKIKKLADEGMQIELAVSLHGFDNPSRNILMPVNKKYPIEELIAACREYIHKTKRQVTFEYILIKGVTCSEKAALALGKLLKGMICKMNLIPYNPVSEFHHQTPSKEEMAFFRHLLNKHGIHATIRAPRGRDVAAACGQLRHTTSDTMPKAYPN